MYFNNDDFCTLTKIILQCSPVGYSLIEREVEEKCQSIFLHMMKYAFDRDTVEGQCFISAVFNEFHISFYPMDGVRTFWGCLMMKKIISDSAGSVFFVDQRDVCRYISTYTPKQLKKETIIFLNNHYGKITITIGNFHQVVTLYQLYKICCGFKKIRTFPFFVIEC